MTRNAEIDLWFGAEKRTFRLGLKQLRKLQEKCADRILGERGPFTILRDLQSGQWKVDDVYQTILLGLIGAGVKEEEAAKLVKERFEDRVGLHEHVLTASAIIMAAMTGPEEDRIESVKGGDPPGEPKAATTGSASPASMVREPSSGGQPETSTT